MNGSNPMRPLAGLFLLATILGAPHPAAAALVLGIGQNFTASTYPTDSAALPPDSNGAVGPLHFVELINGQFAVYDKATGTRLLSSTDLSFWNSAGVTFSPTFGVTDPRIVYDSQAQRWFASAIDLDLLGNLANRFLLAVSSGTDPTGPWKGLALPADPTGGNVADFPTMGVDANGVYLSADLFDALGNPVGAALVSIPKAGLLAPTPSAANLTSFGILNYTNRGTILQPAVCMDPSTNGEALLAAGDLGYDGLPHSTLVLSTVLNAAGPAPAALSAAATLNVSPYSIPINPPQPDGSANLDDGDPRFSATVFQVGGVLYAVHAIEVTNRAAIRWYTLSATNHAVLQSGTIADTNLDLFYPSIAANSNGTVVIAFNGCSSNSFVSAYAVLGETVSNVTVFGGLLLLKAGTASYQNTDSTGVSRWGDYSATTVDPADPTRFWTIQMYPSGRHAWSTQITELLTRELAMTVARAGTNLLLSWPGQATGFQLEIAADLGAGAAWTPVTQGLSTQNGTVYARIPLSETRRFFRLHRTGP